MSIAAASVLAKVHRDAIKVRLDNKVSLCMVLPVHKGYGSAGHFAALAQHGVCSHHRPTYAQLLNYET